MHPGQLPKATLFELYDCGFGVAKKYEESWRPPPFPTPKDLHFVESRLETRLPSLLVDLAGASVFFVQWFATLGDPAYSPTTPNLHIVAKNEYLNERGKPSDLIVINQAYDGDCIGFRRRANADPDNAPIEYLAVDLWSTNTASKEEVVAPNFHAYLEDLCLQKALKSRIKSRRRRAQKLISEWEDRLSKESGE